MIRTVSGKMNRISVSAKRKERTWMSADNGIYILAARDQYRVAHAQGIDHLYWSFSEGYCGNRIVPTRVLEVWGNLPHTGDAGTAIQVAERLRRKIPVCEYGICVIPLKMTWRKLRQSARTYAGEELRSLEEHGWCLEADRRLLLEIRQGRIR